MNDVANENTATELYTSAKPGQNLEHMCQMKVAMSTRAINGASRRNPTSQPEDVVLKPPGTLTSDETAGYTEQQTWLRASRGAN